MGLNKKKYMACILLCKTEIIVTFLRKAQECQSNRALSGILFTIYFEIRKPSVNSLLLWFISSFCGAENSPSQGTGLWALKLWTIRPFFSQFWYGGDWSLSSFAKESKMDLNTNNPCTGWAGTYVKLPNVIWLAVSKGSEAIFEIFYNATTNG